MLDLDHVKAVNDRLGHEAGDRVLVEVAERLRTLLPDESLLARLWGDEFAILLQGEPRDVAGMAGRIVAVVRQPFTLDAGHVCIGARIGIAGGDLSGSSPKHLLQAADTAMYQAKVAGRAPYAVSGAAASDAISAPW